MKKGYALIVMMFLAVINTYGQCAMCKASIESSDSDVGSGINGGILYIMPVPYILLAIIGFVIYYKMKKSRIH